MKTIKIFLASSEELDNDRMAFGNLVRRLDDIYEKRGIRIKLFEWEDYDAAFNDRRKQDEYNDCATYRELEQYDKALEFIHKDYDIASHMFKATILNRLGRTYVAMGDKEMAQAKLQAVIELLPRK